MPHCQMESALALKLIMLVQHMACPDCNDICNVAAVFNGIKITSQPHKLFIPFASNEQMS